MKVIVGLGNPEKKYELTRHNVGFIILDMYLDYPQFSEKKNYLYYEKIINGEKVLFVKPLTYMNNSGIAVSEIIKFYKISTDNILVIQDDISLPLGKNRIKYDSTDGGHNGIKSIISHLGTKKIYRLKVGLENSNNIDTVSFVLGKLSKEEIETIKKSKEYYCNIIDSFINNNEETWKIYE